MTKIYVLHKLDWDDCEVIAAYTDKEEAVKAKNRFGGAEEDWEIKEIPLYDEKSV